MRGSPKCAGVLFVAHGRERDLLELVVGYGLILLTVWTRQPWQELFYCSALSWLVLVLGLGWGNRSTMGLRLSGSLRSLWVFGMALLLAGAAVALADRLHTLHLPKDLGGFVHRYGGYAIWAFWQEVLLLDFVLLRLLRLLRNPNAAVIAAAGLFALAHLPNPILTPATLLWGVVACLLFLQYRNLYTLAMTHAILGICIAATIPGPINHNMRVGLGYLTYQRPIAGGYVLPGNGAPRPRVGAAVTGLGASSEQPEGPNGIHGGMGDGRGCDAALLAPGAAVEDSRQSSQEDVTPVEVSRAFVEVSQPEECGGQQERGKPSETTLQQVLQPSAKEKFFRDGDEKEG